MVTPDLEFASRRSPVLGRRGMVATTQPLAVAAGLEILSQGGNAADAAVATAAALSVTEPMSTGLGGDCFALYYHADTGQITALNGSGRAPAALTLERLAKEGLGNDLPMYHPYTITVPGACAGWCDLLERHGQLPMATVLAPAIRLAEEGFPVAPLTAYLWAYDGLERLRQAFGGRELTMDGRAPRAGEVFRNPGLASTLRAVAEGGKAQFYKGEAGEAIARTVQAAGGCLSVDDLAAHESTWDQPISATYRGLRIWEAPPNGHGVAALLALNILEGFDISATPPLSTRRLHLAIEAMRLGFADARYYVADPAFGSTAWEGLLSEGYAAQRGLLVDPKKANPNLQHGTPPPASDTVYLSVVDGDGNACSFINSVYKGFGTGIVPPGWGFALQNRGACFSLDPSHPNALAPHKRPYHTIIPALATREYDNSLFACFGVMGGYMQPQGHLQVVIALADDHLDPQAALDRPRFCITSGTAGGQVALEEGIPIKVMSELAQMGHSIIPLSGNERSPIFGRGQIILRDGESGVLWGGSDPRGDGVAFGL